MKGNKKKHLPRIYGSSEDVIVNYKTINIKLDNFSWNLDGPKKMSVRKESKVLHALKFKIWIKKMEFECFQINEFC